MTGSYQVMMGVSPIGGKRAVVNAATANAVSSSPIQARWQADSAGNVNTTVNSVFAFRYAWKLSSDAASGFWIRATLVSGTNPTSGTMNTWLQLSTTREWQMQNPISVGANSGVIKIEIAADSGGAQVLSSANITLSSQKV